jgi:hypothetical protein
MHPLCALVSAGAAHRAADALTMCGGPALVAAFDYLADALGGES